MNVIPQGQRLSMFGVLPDGQHITNFQGSTWSVMDMRTTFAGIPQYKLVEKLRGMQDVLGWKRGILILPKQD